MIMNAAHHTVTLHSPARHHRKEDSTEKPRAIISVREGQIVNTKPRGQPFVDSAQQVKEQESAPDVTKYTKSVYPSAQMVKHTMSLFVSPDRSGGLTNPLKLKSK